MTIARKSLVLSAFFVLTLTSVCLAQGQDYSGSEDPNRKILKQGVLGAATGAIAAETSGGKAGQGALVGAGTNVIGGALLDTLTGSGSSSQARPQTVYVQQPAYQPAPSYTTSSYPVQTQQVYDTRQQVYAQPQPVYYTTQQAAPAQDPNKAIIKNALLGAGTGAIAASTSGGKAGKGALVGAGTSVIGNALFDSILGGGSSAQQQPQQVVYVQQPQYQQPAYQQPTYYSNTSSSTSAPKKKIVRKYDADGNVISEEEVWE